MKWWSRVWRRKQMEEQLEKELRFHLEAHAEDLVASGRDAREAEREARLALGGPEQVKEICRDARGTRWLENFGRDLRYALRMYRRSPGFTATALLAISLGIGATTAVFSVSDRILFRSLPYREDGALASFGMLAKVVDDGEFLFAADYKDLLEAETPFERIASWSGVRDCDIMDQSPVRQHCAEVDANFLPVLGIAPVLGETFAKVDTQPGAPAKVMIGYGVWQSHFAGDRRIVGKTLTLDGAPARIVGVLPKSFELPTLERADLLVPQIISPAGWSHNATRVLRTIGRLKPGINLQTARLQLTPYFNRILSFVPLQFQKEVQFRVRSVRDRQMGGFQLAAWTLLAAALAVVLLSCTNVANLLLARAAGRQAELAIRRALGISEGRLVCQMLTESLLLAVSGGVIGCVLGFALLRILVAADPAGIPHLADASLDGRVLIVAMLLSFVVGLLFGSAPILLRQRSELLVGASRVAPRASTALKNVLVTVQIALSIVLLTAAGLLVRSLWNLQRQPLGMQSQHVLTAQLVLPSSSYTKPEQRIAFFNQIEQQIGSIPGVQSFGLSDSLPPGGWQRSRPLSSLEVVGHPRQSAGTGGMVNWRYVSPGYFEALRIPVLAGREFAKSDQRPGINLCIVSRSLKPRLFPSQNAVGQHLKFQIGSTASSAAYEVVGVVPDVKNTGLAVADNPEYYILRTRTLDETYMSLTGGLAQRLLSIVIRSAIPDTVLTREVKQKIAAVDGTIPIEIKTMYGRLDELVAGPRFNARLLMIFAAVGLFLAAIGLYGTISYLATQRTQEIGIRMSLGATPSGIAWLLFRQAGKWTLAGAAIGILASLGSTRVLSSLLFRVPANDPLALLIAVSCLVAAATLAIANPLRLAAKIDPARTLRNNN